MDQLFGYGLIAVDESMLDELNELDDTQELSFPEYHHKFYDDDEDDK